MERLLKEAGVDLSAPDGRLADIASLADKHIARLERVRRDLFLGQLHTIHTRQIQEVPLNIRVSEIWDTGLSICPVP